MLHQFLCERRFDQWEIVMITYQLNVTFLVSSGFTYGHMFYNIHIDIEAGAIIKISELGNNNLI